jgi:DNA-binding XRE family transcriptional regulator
MKEISRIEIIKRIEWLRLELGLSKSDFAKSFGVARNTYGNWVKSGEQVIPLTASISICIKYGVSLDFIYFGKIRDLPVELFDKWIKSSPEMDS